MLSGKKTFVGFGFGPIQSGLFLYEAFQSGAFKRLVVAEINPHLVGALRRARGFFDLNIAHNDHIEHAHVGPVEILNPLDPLERKVLVAAIAEADEISTAVPSVEHYKSEGEGSLHRIVVEGLIRKMEREWPQAVVYAAENNNHAAEILEEHVQSCIPSAWQASVHASVQFLNTVIGKMSQVVDDPQEIAWRGLKTITADYPKAFLVESFNTILISEIRLPPPFERGIRVFEEKKAGLLPFEEVKLYGHNAAHALLGYLGKWMGLKFVREAGSVPGLLFFVRAAFLQESGGALVSKYPGMDPLFTHSGYQEYAEDLLVRMANPFLGDSIERVIRDTPRKLEWNDRLIGTMRLALEYGILPLRFALGVAAAVMHLEPAFLDQQSAGAELLGGIWKEALPGEQERREIMNLVLRGRKLLIEWRDDGFPDLEAYFIKHTS